MKNLHNKELQCDLIKFSYNFVGKYGELYFPDSHCCDMDGAINFFIKIDPEVRAIYTFSGEESDTLYRKTDGQWMAI